MEFCNHTYPFFHLLFVFQNSGQTGPPDGLADKMRTKASHDIFTNPGRWENNPYEATKFLRLILSLLAPKMATEPREEDY